jgi:hypothetical protein
MEYRRTEATFVVRSAGAKPAQPKIYSTVWLKKGQDRFLFHCFRCKNPILSVRGSVFMIAPGRANIDGQPEVTDQDIQVNCDGYIENWGACPYRYTFSFTE